MNVPRMQTKNSTALWRRPWYQWPRPGTNPTFVPGAAGNGAHFQAALTPNNKQLTFAALLELPGAQTAAGPDTASLSGDINGSGLQLLGQINDWTPLGNSVEFNGTLKAVVGFQTKSLNLAFDVQALGGNRWPPRRRSPPSASPRHCSGAFSRWPSPPWPIRRWRSATYLVFR